MAIDDFLSPADLAIRVGGKAALPDELARRAARALDLDAGPVRPALEKRERLGFTGVGDGIAQPHARLDAVRRPFGCLASLHDAVDFDAIDERPADLGRVDGFDEDEGERERDEGAVVLGGFLAAQSDAFEALELTHGPLDARPSGIESLREEGGLVPGG